MNPEPKKKLPNKKVISSAKFEAKEQFTKSALENLKTENETFNIVKKIQDYKNNKENYLNSENENMCFFIFSIFHFFRNLTPRDKKIRILQVKICISAKRCRNPMEF